MDFNQWYKKSIETQPEDPPEGLWESIQNELDINDVWIRLEADLGTPQKTIFPLLLTIAASFLFIVFIGSLFYLNHYKLNKVETADIYIIDEPDKNEAVDIERPVVTDNLDPLITIDHTNYLVEFSDESVQAIAKASDSHQLIFNDISSTVYIPGKPENATPGQYMLASINPIGISTEGSIENQTMLIKDKQRGSIFNTSMEYNNNKRFSDITIGLGGQLANTWLLNDKTINGFRGTSLTHTNATIGQSFGLLASTNTGTKSWLRLEWYFQAQNGQNYHEYIYGQYTSTRLKLNYQNLALTWHVMPGKQTNPHRLFAGMYTGYLKDATLLINKTRYNVFDDYSSFDYGVIFGYEYLFQWKKSLTFNIGLYSKIGLSNVFAGNEYIPASLNHTQNAALMLSFSVNYSLP
jgi:hypothetical protein